MWHGKRLAPFSDDVALEKFVAGLWEQRHPRGAAPRMGRNGQAQGGLDVLVRTADKRAIGIQCKAVAKLTPKLLKEEMAKAVASGIRLDEFVLASSALHDAPTVVAAHELSDAHRARGLFPVTVYGWDELQRMAEAYPALIAQFFPEFVIVPPVPKPAPLPIAVDGSVLLMDADLRAFCRGTAVWLRDEDDATVQVADVDEQWAQRCRAANRVGDAPAMDPEPSGVAAKVRQLETALTLLLKAAGQDGSPMLGDDWDAAAQVVRALVPHVLKPAITTVPGSLALKIRSRQRSALVAWIDLFDGDRTEFLRRYREHKGYFFLADPARMGADLGYRHLLAAGLAAVARYADAHGVPVAELRDEGSTEIFGWRLEAA